MIETSCRRHQSDGDRRLAEHDSVVLAQSAVLLSCSAWTGPAADPYREAMPETFVLEPQLRAALMDLSIDASAVLARAGLPRDLLARGHVSVPVADYYRLWRAAETVWDGPPLALELSRAISAEAFCATTFAALCAPDLNHAAERAQQFKPLTGPIRYELVVTEEATTIGCDWSLAGEPPPPSLAHANLIYWVALARLATRADITPIGYSAPPLDHTGPIADYLGTDVSHSGQHEVVFAAADAAMPFVTANVTMWNYFEPGLRHHLGELTTAASTTERVRAVLLELLPAGGASLEAVGHELGLSARTLQRRLRDERASYQTILADVRRDLAVHYLQSSDVSLAQIALLLGYEEPTSFQRAFTAWTGTTPTRFQFEVRS